MKRASHFLTEEDRKTISEAVAEAEKNTSGEIVPAIATVSGRYDRAEDIAGLALALAAVTLSWTLFQDIRFPEGDWTAGPRIALGLLPCLVIILMGFAAGSALASYVPVLRRPFIARKEMDEEVERRAHEVFARERVRGTTGGTGILIYVSLYERIVRVLPDDAIAGKISQAEWNAVRDLVLDGIKTEHPGQGLTQAVLKCGELLKEHFPIEPGDVNELTNELRILD
jgi:putative membrane protein